MRRRLLAVAAAVVLAGVGAVLLLNYVAGADQRAIAGVETVSVYVVVAPIAQGTPAESLGTLVALKALPAKAVAAGSMSSLDKLAGKVSTVDLQSGEQLLASRFADPATQQGTGTVSIPKGFHEISVLLDSKRVLGGHLAQGARVGVFISLDTKTTHLAIDQVLVSRVQGGATTAPATGDKAASAAPDVAPGGSVMVTLVVKAPDAERLVYAAEFARLWLSLEAPDASAGGTKIVTEKNLYS